MTSEFKDYIFLASWGIGFIFINVVMWLDMHSQVKKAERMLRDAYISKLSDEFNIQLTKEQQRGSLDDLRSLLYEATTERIKASLKNN